MKQYPWNFRLVKGGIEWGQSEVTIGTGIYFYYFYISTLNRKVREGLKQLDYPVVGFYNFWYDGPHAGLNLYFFAICWSTPWTRDKTS